MPVLRIPSSTALLLAVAHSDHRLYPAFYTPIATANPTLVHNIIPSPQSISWRRPLA